MYMHDPAKDLAANRDDRRAIDAIQGKDCYRVRDRIGRILTVVDIGAHIGSFSVLARDLWPEATISAYEPNPESFGLLQRNTEGLQIRCYQEAVWQEFGERDFQVSHVPTCSTLKAVASARRDTGHNILVQCETLSHIIAVVGRIDVLKLDCEGSELAILKEASFGLNRVGYIVGEYHGDEKYRERLCMTMLDTHTVTTEQHKRNRGLFFAEAI